MAAPTITYSGTTVTLPYPSAAGSNDRDYQEFLNQRRTAAGILRTSVMSRNYVYKLTFEEVDISTYDAVIALWEAATDAGAYPTFSFTSLWATADAVSVSIDIGAAKPAPGGNQHVGFSLVLTEVSPR